MLETVLSQLKREMAKYQLFSYLDESFDVDFREKAELWQKADNMEHEIKLKADDRWMDDSEVSHCLGCKAEFSFLLRKVCVASV